MELLWEYPEEGLTSKKIATVYFCDTSQKAISMALSRLVYQNSAHRIRDPRVPFGYIYFINDYGIEKMYFLQDRNELEAEFEEEDEEDSEIISDLEDEILMLERKRDRL